MAVEHQDTNHKALKLNLENRIYGTIAEIGAGQEVARWFFRVGGAAGTVAKTMSAYDMTYSDQIYGKGTRYVSKDRLISMLAHEYDLCVSRLGEKRGKDTTFFAFANTVAARNHNGTNECHGWIGIRFQETPQGASSDMLLHVNLMDQTNVLQQAAMGILGVNLIYGAYYCRETLPAFLESLVDGLEPGRVEIDYVEFRDKAFVEVSPLVIGNQLIESKLCQAVLFDREGRLAPPTEVFHNRPLLLLRGVFERPPSRIHKRMLETALPLLQSECGEAEHEPVSFFELSRAAVTDAAIDPQAVPQRIMQLLEWSDWVLLSHISENYMLTHYLRRYVEAQPIRFVLGISSLVFLLHSAYYKNLPGQLLEGVAKFLADNVKVYVESMPQEMFSVQVKELLGSDMLFRIPDAPWISLENLDFDPPLSHLLRYLSSVGALVPLNPS
jgi:hypothetical protein